jgi:hypothetical protein
MSNFFLKRTGLRSTGSLMEELFITSHQGEKQCQQGVQVDPVVKKIYNRMNSKQTAVEWLIEQCPRIETIVAYNILEQAKEMEQILNTSKINRVEVIQHSEPYNGRAYTNYNAKDVEVQFQDEGETLKIFLK